MQRKRIDPRRIKIHRSYTIEELAAVLGCHKNTVRGWLKRGMKPLLDGKRPLLFQGQETRTFLESRRDAAKRKCRPEEMYCFKCRAPRRPAEDMIDYRPSDAGGVLSGLCGECSTIMFKRTSPAILDRLTPLLDVKILERAPTPNLAASPHPKL